MRHREKYDDENCPKAGLHAILITIELLWGTGLNASLCNHDKPPLTGTQNLTIEKKFTVQKVLKLSDHIGLFHLFNIGLAAVVKFSYSAKVIDILSFQVHFPPIQIAH